MSTGAHHKDHTFSNTGFHIFPGLQSVGRTWSLAHKRCAYPQCNKQLPTGHRSPYCKSYCRIRHEREKLGIKIKTQTRRPGL